MVNKQPIFKQFKLLKVNQILQMQEFKFYHKFKNSTYLQQLKLLPNSSIHSHNTRGKTDLHIHRKTHTFAKKCIRQNTPVLQNNAPRGYTCDRITKIQERAIRLINLSRYNAHTEPIFNQFKLLKSKSLPSDARI